MGQGAWLERTSGIILPKALQNPTIFVFRVFSRLWPLNTTFIATKKHKIHKERVERRASRVESLRGVHLITKLPATRHDFFSRLFAASFLSRCSTLVTRLPPSVLRHCPFPFLRLFAPLRGHNFPAAHYQQPSNSRPPYDARVASCEGVSNSSFLLLTFYFPRASRHPSREPF
jgi:hypothetical protein